MRNIWIYSLLVFLGIVGLALSIAALFGLINIVLFAIIIMIFFVVIIIISIILLVVTLSCRR